MNKNSFIFLILFLFISPVFSSSPVFIMLTGLVCVFNKIKVGNLFILLFFLAYIMFEFFFGLIYLPHNFNSGLYFLFVSFLIFVFYRNFFAGIDLISNTDKYFYFLTFSSLLLFILINIFPTLQNLSFTYAYGDSNKEFLGNTFFILNFLKDETILFRFMGFSSEPAMWGVISLIYFNNFLNTYNTKANFYYLKFFIYLFSIILTFSAVSYFLLFIVLSRFIIKSIILSFISVFFFVFIFSYFNNFFDNVFLKLSVDSFLVRSEKGVEALNLVLSNPFGLGSSGYNYFYNHPDFSIGAHDSYSQLLLRYGFIGIFIYLIILFKIMSKNFIVSLILLFSSLTQMVVFSPFFIFLIISFLI